MNKTKSYNKFFLLLGILVFLMGLGLILNDLNIDEDNRTIASQGVSEKDRELIDVATKKLIEKVQDSNGFVYGKSPSAIESFIYGELSGQYKVSQIEQGSLLIEKVGEGVQVKNPKSFAKKVLKLLIPENQALRLSEDQRTVAESKNIKVFQVEDAENNVFAKISMDIQGDQLISLTFKQI